MSDEKYKAIGDPLDCLAEECAEIIQILMKIKRFGFINDEYNNIEQLNNEMYDVEERIKEVRDIISDMRPDKWCECNKEIKNNSINETDWNGIIHCVVCHKDRKPNKT